MLWRSQDMVIGNIISYSPDLGFTDIAVFTNGTFPLDLEGVTFIVTIDGTKESHNSIRADTYDLVLRHVRSSKSKINASVTLTKANVAQLEAARQADRTVCWRKSLHLLSGCRQF